MYYVFRCLMTSFFYISNFLNTASRAIFSNLSSNGFKSLYLKSGFLFCSAFEITKSDITTGEELQGSKLKVYDEGFYDGKIIGT